ncbi:phosphodiester glycosidase family protein [Streptomyces sp. MH60]|uniref:phosphodiester glycosidase family protein n=1 Tax=Streptomyces sp. MH60 TaxID=1940758 RepID=UPI000D494096|nr:phosphodiester glycosidase family protein [Streptomyces sp. MH60]PPS89465.1 hypothetical protein BZZ08_01611 [Streptomyces sp. MH60]
MAANKMPLGSAGQTLAAGPVSTLMPGVTYQELTQGYASNVWSVWAWRVGGPETYGNQATAQALVTELSGLGFASRLDTLTAFAAADTAGGVIGYAVRVGSFAPQQMNEAVTLQASLVSAGYQGRVIYTAEDGVPSEGPWEVRVVRVDADAKVRLKAVHGAQVSTSKTVRSMAVASRALVAVNGGEFDIKTMAGHSGYEVPQGLYVQDNTLLSAANNGRTALLLEGVGQRVRVTEASSSLRIKTVDGAERAVDGINRVPSRVLGCGGVGGDTLVVDGVATPTLKPWRNLICTDPDEVVIFRPEWGAATPAPWQGVTNSVDVVMNGNWVVQELRSPAGGAIPTGGRVLQGIGTGADWLRTHAKVGEMVTPTASITDAAGAAVTSPTLSGVAGGGPALVRGGAKSVNIGANGMTSFTGAPNLSSVQRHPRTLAGVTASGQFLLVTVDGRNPGRSVGLTWSEAADLMLWLGATEAVGLGSGGDTAMVVSNALSNSPRDTWNTQDTIPYERSVATAVVVVPDDVQPAPVSTIPAGISGWDAPLNEALVGLQTQISYLTAATAAVVEQLGDGTGLPLQNVAATPATTPTGGVLYVEAGVLKYRGGKGTVTTLGPA